MAQGINSPVASDRLTHPRRTSWGPMSGVSHMENSTSSVLRSVSNHVWGLLTAAHRLNVSLNEATLTDLVSLQLSRARPEVQVRMLPKNEEAVVGADWDWWVGNASVGWVRILVQAKKLFLPDARYRHLRHKVVDDGLPELQFDRLEAYAASEEALAYYCFFNGAVASATPDWGCTMAALSSIRPAHEKRGRRDFFAIHRNCGAEPWHNVVQLWGQGRDGSARRHPALPAWVTDELRRPDAGDVAEAELEGLSGEWPPGAIGLMVTPEWPGIDSPATRMPKPAHKKKLFSSRFLVVVEVPPTG